MNTVLVAEDEKMIRKGICAMIKRSSVPVEAVMECSNGETALEIIKEHPVDVLFTDIRMPKMDGITLVKEIQKVRYKPLIVAISGYDDFSYAVEMLRSGVREYILKPVEREKITEILETLEKELKNRNKKRRLDESMEKNQLFLLLTQKTKMGGLNGIYDTIEADFFPKGYCICAAGKGFVMEDREDTVFLDQMEDGNICILRPELLPVILKNELWQETAGVGQIHYSLKELRDAYQEGMEARKRAFFSMDHQIMDDEWNRKKIPEALRKEGRKLLEENAWHQRVQLIGTEKTEELEYVFRVFFESAKKGWIFPGEFQQGMERFFLEMKETYGGILDDPQMDQIKKLKNIYAFSGIEEYQEEVMSLVLDVHSQTAKSRETSINAQKISQAIDFIRENYSKPLNMAVVSNYVSMNYSLFSYEFKQYTGSNFVNYLKELRMEQARKLLAQTDLKILEVSQQVGYENEKHFMKTFKSIYGVSPSEFRKNTEVRKS